MTTETPDWLKPGAKVLVYSISARDVNTRNLKITTVKKLAGKSFTVEDEHEPRFKLSDQKGRVEHGGWSSTTRLVVPYDSDEARREFEEFRLYRLQVEARNAVETWIRKRTRENRLAAIGALQAIQVDESS